MAIKKKIKKVRDLLANKSPIKSPGDSLRAVADKFAEIAKIPSNKVQKLQEKTLKKKGNVFGKIGKAAAEEILLRIPADMLWFVAWLARTTFANNMIIRGTERYLAEDEKHHLKKKGGIKFSRRHPMASAYLYYYMLLITAAMTGNVGGIRTKAVDAVKQGIHKIIGAKEDKQKDIQESIVINSDDKRTGAEWCRTEYANALCVAVPLVFEECFTAAKYTPVDGKWNIGYSMTSMPADKSKPYGKWRRAKEGDTCTEDEAALWAAVYNQKYIFPIISEKLKVQVSLGMILALADLSYNSGALGIMLARLNDGWTEGQILDKMLEYRKAKVKGKLTVLDGLVVRRWWDYAAGKNALDYGGLLDCRLTAVSQVGSNQLYSDKAKYLPIITPKKVNQVLTAGVPSKPSVRDIFSRSPTGRKYISAIQNAGSGSQSFIAIQPEQDDSELSVLNDIAFAAQTAFDKGDYATAEQKFREMIKLAPDAYDSYNDLIFTLYKLGKYDDGLKYAKILIALGHENDVEEDKLFGAAYYNAGLCREAKGELEEARKNYRTASIRMPDNKLVKEALKRVEEKLKARKSPEQSSKPSAYNSSSKRLDRMMAEQNGSKTFDATEFFLEREGRA